MKRTTFYLLITAALLALALFVWSHHKPTPTSQQSVSASSIPSQQSDSETKPGDIVATNTAAPAQNRSAITQSQISSKPPNGSTYFQKIRADPNYDWKQPINFYGRVVDESNAPVSGASVHFQWNDLSPKGTSDADVTSDNNGFFSLKERHGKYLFVTVSKEGYYSSGNSRGSGFEYANPYDGLFTPDVGNPIVFHLRKKGQCEPLIHGEKLFGFETNGTVRYLDLMKEKNQLAPPGDLAVQCTRSPRNNNGKYDWSVKISVPDGGLLQSDEEFMFEAPTEGYQPAIEIQQAADDPKWTSGAKLRFYFNSRNGNIFGRVEATIYARYQTGAAIDVDYYVNPSSSRNLEFDPSKQIQTAK